MNDVQRLKNLRLEKNTVVVVRPDRDNWYEILDVSDELRLRGVTVIVLDRFSSNIHIMSENRMNEMGWYKSE